MAKQNKPDELAITIKLRGEPKAVVGALVNGLPREALEQIRDRMALEATRRAKKPARGRRRVKMTIRNPK